jgi:hypothetical protein
MQLDSKTLKVIEELKKQIQLLTKAINDIAKKI